MEKELICPHDGHPNFGLMLIDEKHFAVCNHCGDIIPIEELNVNE